MKNIYRDLKTARRLRLSALALASTLVLVACGGGGGNPGSTSGTGSGAVGGGTGADTTTPAPVATATLAVTLVDANGTASSALSGTAPLTARATVKDKDGKVVAGAIVAFATDAKLGLFTPSAGTSLTDATGVATIGLRAATLLANGAGSLTATSTVAGATVTGSTNFTIGGTVLTFGPLSASVTSLPAYGSTTLSIDVLSGGAKYTAQSVDLNFGSACVAAGKATVAKIVATKGGTAQAVYRDQGCGNNDTITVSSDNLTATASTSLTIAKPAPASVQFSAVSPVGQSIVIAGQGGLNRTETATLTFKVIDTFGNPLAGQTVNFTASTTLVTVNKASDTTDAQGLVATTVNSGSQPVAFSILATLPSTGINTRSDSIAVTTGLPDQAHFSIGASIFNTDGLNFDSGNVTPASSITASLGDQNGNPVTDGVSVVFSTNMGVIGSAAQGSCNTVNGSCSVDFRTQSPRVATPNMPATPCNTGAGSSPDSTRPGLASVCASITDFKTTLFRRIGVFFGGTTATGILNGGIALQANTATPYDLGAITRTDSKRFTIQFNDVNGNPMPMGSTVAVTDTVGLASGTANPNVVPNIGPVAPNGDISGGNVVGNQGSTHTFTVVPTPFSSTLPCIPIASFNVTIVAAPTTSHGISTTFPFKLAVSCQ